MSLLTSAKEVDTVSFSRISTLKCNILGAGNLCLFYRIIHGGIYV
jgi:hypothetical protein